MCVYVCVCVCMCVCLCVPSVGNRHRTFLVDIFMGSPMFADCMTSSQLVCLRVCKYLLTSP